MRRVRMRRDQDGAEPMNAPCPALTPCRSYGLSHPLEFGVYGQLTNGNRQTRKTNPTKAA